MEFSMTAYRCYQCHKFNIPFYCEFVCLDCRRGVTVTDTNGVDFRMPKEALWS